MVQLVESSPGHVKGSFTISSLNKDGTRKKDKIYSISGSVNGTNISIQIVGGMSELAKLFGANTTFVGNISGSALTLSLGGTSSTFHKVTEAQYQAVLRAMDEYGKRTGMLYDSMKAVAQSRSHAESLNNKLKHYIAWSQKRIARTSIVKQWYIKRITYYTRCLNTIKPLAERNVPSWRWQGCVLKVENDEYNRQKEHEDIASALSKNRDIINKFNSEIISIRKSFPAIVTNLRAACRYAKSPTKCNDSAKSLAALSPNGFLDATLSAKYSGIAPKTTVALTSDANVSRKGEAKLSALAKKVTRIYHSAE